MCASVSESHGINYIMYNQSINKLYSTDAYYNNGISGWVKINKMKSIGGRVNRYLQLLLFYESVLIQFYKNLGTITINNNAPQFSLPCVGSHLSEIRNRHPNLEIDGNDPSNNENTIAAAIKTITSEEKNNTRFRILSLFIYFRILFPL